MDNPGGFIGPGIKIRGLQTAESNEPLGYFGYFAELDEPVQASGQLQPASTICRGCVCFITVV